ncbi:MAG: hypothetical protein JWM32_1191 [Verrucomicrobia bacterium]|nr:hypothetical protein [Verrucomicrobiota bacterium]
MNRASTRTFTTDFEVRTDVCIRAHSRLKNRRGRRRKVDPVIPTANLRGIINSGPVHRLRACFLPLVAVAIALLPATRFLGAQVTASSTVGWNTNASNGDRSEDKIGALLFDADVDFFLHRFQLGHDDALILSANVAAEAWPRFDGLNHISAGPRLAWQHKFGLGALAPVLRVEFAADDIEARDPERSAHEGSGRIAWQQRFDESTQLTASYRRVHRTAEDELYNQEADEAALEVSRQLDERWSLTVTARWRRGDVLSYATALRPELAAIARDRDTVTTFGRPQTAYALDARSFGAAFDLTRTLDEKTALTFGYESRITEHSPLRYVNHLLSVSISRQL